MKKRNLWAIAFLAFPCLCAMGEDVYVYSDAAGEPVQAFTGIRKITFSENAMQVMAADGTSSEVLFTDFHYFTFVEKENSHMSERQPSGRYMQQTAVAQNLCSKCGVPVPAGANFCPKCGMAVSSNEIYCPGCGKQVETGSNFCPYCGKSIQ